MADFGFGNNRHKDRHLTTYYGSPFYAVPKMVSGSPLRLGPRPTSGLWVPFSISLSVDASPLIPVTCLSTFAQIKRENYLVPRQGSIDVCSLICRILTVNPKRPATLTDVLRYRWMHADDMDTIFATLLALSTAPVTIRPPSTFATRTNPPQQQQQQQQQLQAKLTGLPIFQRN